ncbi:MAG: outer membrane protein assembly factor BamA [Ahniella sp.]|nr:outer membrane protein assembly factor BamA [Ahniella sp.]
MANNAMAFDPFVVSDIRLEGLTRVPAGTVFASLPIEKGDRLDRVRAGDAIRALFRTGFFNDIQLKRQGEILVINFVERPAISKLTLTGNKDIKTEDLMKGLKEIGLAEGETFDRLQLDRITQELTRQYNNRGKYNVSIKPRVEEIDRNRVDITIDVTEGKASKIRHFNIYQDRGYVDFNVESTQVAVSQDKREIFVTANVREGDVYKLTDLKITGDLVLDEEALRSLVPAEPGETYSRAKIEAGADRISKVLSNIGYAFAEVSPIPELNAEKREIGITLMVQPGQRVYVRRVTFIGNERTQDEVLRREMRQLEGTWFSQAAIDRSKIRMQRLGFFKNVTIETPKVPGANDQIDVVVSVEEQSAGSFQFGLGYSELQGLITSVSLQQRNFLGTGNTVGVTVQNNSFVKRLDFSFLDPYFTDEGVSLGYQVSYRELDNGDANQAQFTTDTAAGDIVMGIPLSETNSVSLSLGIDRNKLTTTDGGTPDSLIDYLVTELGDRDRFPVPNIDPVTGLPNVPAGPFRQWTVNTWKLTAGWASDSRNKFFAPTRGTFQRVFGEASLPGSDLEYYKINYEYARYFPMGERFSLLNRTEVGYGDGYGDTGGLPFYERFYAGGTRSVRGFEDNTLGPTEASPSNPDFLQPLGGSFKFANTTELIFPTPFSKSDSDTAQFSAFVDVGNVWSEVREFGRGDLRASAGLSFKWQAPVGPIIINFAVPLQKEDTDRTESIQFSFGSQF